MTNASPVTTSREKLSHLFERSPYNLHTSGFSSQPAIDSSYLRIFAASIISQFANGLPPLDGEMSILYNNAIAELEYEMFSPLELEPDFECEISVIDDLTPHATPIDY